ncbi:MAG TPA: sulfotransferase [Candidatus Eisenbacteria bacterium]|nr:sulfotransferase [Candidatus Eisenbacteria bacterium]
MALALIGAGLGRTGTLSLKAALERIGYGPCYHMLEILTAPERARHWLEKTPSGALDWDTIFRGYRATVDWPAAAFWRELVAHYPDAKVLLSLRDADRWYDSVANTIYPALMQGPPERAPAILHEFHRMAYDLIFERTFGGRLGDRAHAKRVFEEHNQAVIDAIPASRLLVYQPGEGWEPICGFLGVPVPDEGFPHLNDTAWYRAHTGLPPIEPRR